MKKEVGSQAKPFFRIRIAGLYLEVGRTTAIYYNIEDLVKGIKSFKKGGLV